MFQVVSAAEVWTFYLCFSSKLSRTPLTAAPISRTMACHTHITPVLPPETYSSRCMQEPEVNCPWFLTPLTWSDAGSTSAFQ